MLDAASPAVRVGVVSRVRQKLEFRSGNEAAALAARDIGYHVMGYFPITPSTEVAENLSKMRANGEHDIVMIAGDGEHGAAGICYGAALGGGRVLNATSSQRQPGGSPPPRYSPDHRLQPEDRFPHRPDTNGRSRTGLQGGAHRLVVHLG
jgi:hypothetical protein